MNLSAFGYFQNQRNLDKKSRAQQHLSFQELSDPANVQSSVAGIKEFVLDYQRQKQIASGDVSEDGDVSAGDDDKTEGEVEEENDAVAGIPKHLEYVKEVC